MAGLPAAAYPRGRDTPIYSTVAEAASTRLRNEMQTTNSSRPDFRKALDGIVGARNREATRQIPRNHEYQLIGAVTKRPN